MSIWTTRRLDRDREYIVLRHPLKGINNIVNGVKFRDGYAVVAKDSKSHHYLKKIPVLRKALELPLTHLKKLKFITRISDIKMVYGEDVYLKYLKAEQDAKLANELATKQALEDARLAEEQRRLEELEKANSIQAELDLIAKEADFTTTAVSTDKGSTITVDLTDESTGDIELGVKELRQSLEAEKPKLTKCSVTTKSGTLCKFDAMDYSPSGYCRLHLLEDPKLEHFGLKIPNAMTKQERKKVRKSINKKLQQLKKQGEF